MRARGFSLLEVMVVVAVVAISGGAAVFAMSDQVGAAKARSDEIGMFLRLKTERNIARERMVGMSVTHSPDGHTLIFHRPVITRTASTRSCSHGVETSRVTFEGATVAFDGAVRCIDESGRPIGSFDLQILGQDGRSSSVHISEGGQIISTLNEKTASDSDAEVITLSETSIESTSQVGP